jgi:hypothetical protein
MFSYLSASRVIKLRKQSKQGLLNIFLAVGLDPSPPSSHMAYLTQNIVLYACLGLAQLWVYMSGVEGTNSYCHKHMVIKENIHH